MRCNDVTRELAAPTGALDPAEVERHRAGCPDCSARARDAERFDRIWAATRPAEPSAAAFDATWSRVTSSLDAPRADRPAVSGRLRGWGLAVAGLAAAAALLLALRPAFEGNPSPTNPGPTGAEEVAAKDLPTYDVEPGQILVIHIGGDDRVRVVHQPSSPGFGPGRIEMVSAVDANFDLLMKAGLLGDQ